MVRRLCLLPALVCSLVLSACGGKAAPRAPAAPLGAVVARAPIPAGRTPVALAVGAGAVWVADAGRGTVLRIDPARRRRVGAAIPVGPAPLAVAVGEGAVWVASASGEIRAIDPRSGRVAGRPTEVRGATGLAVGLGGVWVTSRIAGTLTRIDPRTRRADRPIRVGEGPADVVVADKAVWVADAAGATVSRVVPGTGRAEAPIRVGGFPLALAGGEGALWIGRSVGAFGEQIEVVRLDPRSRRVTGRPVVVPGAIPLDLAAGGGSVWATDVGGPRPPQPTRPGVVTRIDPGRLTRAAALRTGKRPTAVAVGAGATWVADASDGTVTPITAAR